MRWTTPQRLVLLLLCGIALFTCSASAQLLPVKKNPADRLLAVPVDDYKYDHAKRCLRQPRKGALALQSWMGRNVGGVSWGIMRCEKWGPKSASLHAEGRALDWHLDARNPAQRREAQRLIALLLAPDAQGNPHALARRMGVQEIIYNCKSWWSGMEKMGKYSPCYSKKSGKRISSVNYTVAHKDHIHLGLNWRGARLRSSFWASALGGPYKP